MSQSTVTATSTALVAIGGLATAVGTLWLWGGVAGALFGSGWPHVGPRPAARNRDPPTLPLWPTRPPRGRPRPERACRAPPGSTPRSRCSRPAGARPRRWSRVASACALGGGGGARWARTRRAPSAPQPRANARPHRAARARAPRRQAAVRRAPPRVGRVRSPAVGQVGGHRDPGAARLGRPGGRELDQDRPASAPRSRGGGRSARCSCSIRSGCPACRRTRGRRCTPRTPGTARSRWRGGSRPPASSTAGAWRAATSGRSLPSSGSRPCCTRQRSAASEWTPSCAGSTDRGCASSTRPLLCAGERRSTPAYDAVRAFEAQADRTRTSIEATAQTLLRAYRFGRVARSAESCEITADRLLDGPATLYLIGDAKASKLLRPIFLALLGEVVDRAYERAHARRRAPGATAAAVPRRGGQRRPAPQPRGDRLDRAEPQHPARHDLPRPRPGPLALRTASRDGRQQPPGADAAAGRRRPRDAPLLRRIDRRGGGARPHAHDRRRWHHALDARAGAVR